MTQLFDTTTYDASPDESGPTRHLRSVAVTNDAELEARRADWYLDPDTIEIGKRGIALARAALQEAAKDRSDKGGAGQRRAAA